MFRAKSGGSATASPGTSLRSEDWSTRYASGGPSPSLSWTADARPPIADALRKKPALPPGRAGRAGRAPLILAAGRSTHRPALRARRETGGLAVALMNPVWPTGQRRRGFDLYVVPEHDGITPAADIILTLGALNPFTPDGPHAPDRGLLLIGGPARRYGWDTVTTLDRIRRIVDETPAVTRWDATSSRRTPADTESALKELHPKVHFAAAADTPRGWVADALAQADRVWVTEDSVSMVYEALTAGCRVGLLPAPHRPGLGQRFLGWGPNRVTRGVQRLAESGQITAYDAWTRGQTLTLPPRPVAEARRVAQVVWARWESPERPR